MTEPASWLEISLTVDGELAEAIADMLSRYIPGGVVIESTAIKATPGEAGEPSGPMRVYGYIPVDGQLEETRQRIEAGLGHLNLIQPLPKPQYRRIEQQNWMEAWKQHYHPIAVGRRLLILPAWAEVPQDTDRLPVRIDPGMAFGTGTHPTTQLCLEALEDAVRSGEPVIDVGCGSGVLSVAALRLGASHALGVDVDAQAVEVAHETATLNGVADHFEIGQGSVAEIRAGRFSLRRAPLVLANILAPILIRLLDDGLADLVAPGGALILSGILEEHLPDVQSALARHHLRVDRTYRQKDWLALTLSRETA